MFETREQWLDAAIVELSAEFAKVQYTVPANVRVSCGWALGTRKAIGQAFSCEQSADQHYETFISPSLANPIDVLGTLTHELCHHIVGNCAKHGPAFKRCATAIGLEGKMTATTVSEALVPVLSAIAEKLGAYPHASLTGSCGKPKQSTRMLKLECGNCGYIVRTTKKHIDAGLPICHCGTTFTADVTAEDSDEI